MKLTKLLLMSLPLTGLAHAHEHSEKEKHEHKEVIQEAVRTGTGKFVYIADAKWGTLPEGKIGATHGGIIIDKAGNIYVSSDGPNGVLVFKPDGTFIKSMAKDLRAMHHMTIREEDGKEFIYGAQLGGKNRIIKLDLSGKIVMTIPNEGTGEVKGGFRGVTGVAVAPTGEIFASVGYGSNFIHKFTAEGKLIKSFGGKNREDKGKFVTPHTLSVDSRYGDPRLLVCDREKRRLVHFDLEGKFIGEYATGLRRPCAVSFWGDYCAVAELESRAVVIDKSGKVISLLGDNPNKKHWANFKLPEEEQKLGVFSAPHGLCFDKNGNLYVQDWNKTGRATKLKLDRAPQRILIK